MIVSRIKDVQMDVVGMHLDWRKNKMLACRIEMLTILKSNLFMKKILEMPEKWTRGDSNSSVFKNLNNNQIYEKLMESREETSKKKDFVANIKIATYRTIANVVGFMTPFKPTIYVNTRYFDNFSRKKVGSNATHEWAHTLGGRHSGPDFRLSVMYYLNEVYEECYVHFFEKGLADIDHDTDLGEDYDSAPVEVPKIPTPQPRKYRVECRRNFWTFWKKTCYRIYDI